MTPSFHHVVAALFAGALLGAPRLPAQDHDHAAGGEEPGEHGEHGDHDEHEPGVVRLSPEVMAEFGIELTAVGAGVLHDEVTLPGEINFNREQLAYVTPRFAGTLQGIRVRLGDTVHKDDVLATLVSNETLRPFEVTAPFDGTIVAYDLTPGQTVEAGRTLFTIADLSNVWADLRVYQKDIAAVHAGQNVRIERAHDAEAYRGTIAYIAPVVDEHTRTGLARVIVDNRSGAWKPGLFVKATVSLAERPVKLLVPRTAVMTLDDATVVFVQTPEGLAPHPVRLGAADSTSFEVLRGVDAGEQVVSANALTVKAELQKASFGEGHHH